VEDPAWGAALPCCALCGRPLEPGRARWVVLDQGLGFAVCHDLEGCEPLRRLVRLRPERFQLGMAWPPSVRPLRVWPAVVRAVARAAGFDESVACRLTLDVAVTTVDGRRQLRPFSYVVPGMAVDPRTAAAFQAVLGRAPCEREVLQPAEWVGRRCGVVLDWCRDQRGRQVVWIHELRPPAA
jgi:hypothetical protein